MTKHSTFSQVLVEIKTVQKCHFDYFQLELEKMHWNLLKQVLHVLQHKGEKNNQKSCQVQDTKDLISSNIRGINLALFWM